MLRAPTAGQASRAASAGQQRRRSSAAAPSALLTGLSSYWTLDEASGVRADSHGSSPLSVVGTVAQAAGKLGQAASFAGAGALEGADTAALRLSAAFGVQAWINPSSSTGFPVVLAKDNGVTREYILYLSGGNVAFGVFNTAGTLTQAMAGSAVTLNVWTHVVATFDGGTVLLYLDGVLSATSGAFTGSLAAAATPLRIGARAVGGSELYLSGLVDSPAVWNNRVLPDADVSYLYNAGAGLAYPFS